MEKETIDNKILKYLKEGNSISQWESYEIFHYTRLSATIHNLIKRGHTVKSRWRILRKGESIKRYKEYWLVEPKAVKKRIEKKEDIQEGFGFNLKRKFEWPD